MKKIFIFLIVLILLFSFLVNAKATNNILDKNLKLVKNNEKELINKKINQVKNSEDIKKTINKDILKDITEKESNLERDSCTDETSFTIGPPRIICAQILGQPKKNENFNIRVLAKDPDDKLTQIKITKLANTNELKSIQSCNSNICDLTFYLKEDSIGTFTYYLEAKNEYNQTGSMTLTVNVKENINEENFILRTAAKESKTSTFYLQNVNITLKYNDEEIKEEGLPFVTFNIKPNNKINLFYQAKNHVSNQKDIFLSNGLFSCNGDSCHIQEADTITDCNSFIDNSGLINYFCRQENEDNKIIEFNFIPYGDSLGNNVVRFINIMDQLITFPLSDKKIKNIELSFGKAKVSFNEGDKLENFDLNSFIDTANFKKENLTWSSTKSNNINVKIDNKNKKATFSNKNNFIGRELIEFKVSTEIGTSASDKLLVEVLPIENYAPKIKYNNPDSYSKINLDINDNKKDFVNFDIYATDRENDHLDYIWRVNGLQVTNNTLRYNFKPKDSGNYNISVEIIDSQNNFVEKNWTVNVEDRKKPDIENLIITPNPVRRFNPVSFSLKIIDNSSIKSAKIEITNPRFSSKTFDLENNAENYFFTFFNTSLAGEYFVNLDIVDNKENRLYTYRGNYKFSVEDEAPIIENFSILPNPQKRLSNIELKAKVSDDIAIDKVEVEVINPLLLRKKIRLNNLMNDFHLIYNETYYAGNYQFKIFAKDDSGNEVATENKVIGVEDNPPEIENITIIPINPKLNSEVEIKALVNEDVELNSVNVLITRPNGFKTTKLMNYLGNYFSVFFNLTSEMGTYLIEVSAEDEIGNKKTLNSTFSIIDNNAPTIDNFTITNYNHNNLRFFFSAAIRDDVSLKTAYLSIRNNSNHTNNITLDKSSVGENNYYLILENQSYGDYKAKIIAIDTSNNYKESEEKSFNLYENIAPIISSLNILPFITETNKPLTFIFKVTDNSGLKEVSAIIKNPVNDMQALQLTKSGDIFTGVFINTAYNGAYLLKITAIDIYDNIQTLEKYIYINDYTAPEIKILSPLENKTYYHQKIDININATDNIGPIYCTFNISNIIKIEQGSCKNLTLNLPIGEHFVEVTVVDGNYNTATDRVNFTINNNGYIVTRFSYQTNSTYNYSLNNVNIEIKDFEKGTLIENLTVIGTNYTFKLKEGRYIFRLFKEGFADINESNVAIVKGATIISDFKFLKFWEIPYQKTSNCVLLYNFNQNYYNTNQEKFLIDSCNNFDAVDNGQIIFNSLKINSNNYNVSFLNSTFFNKTLINIISTLGRLIPNTFTVEAWANLNLNSTDINAPNESTLFMHGISESNNIILGFRTNNGYSKTLFKYGDIVLTGNNLVKNNEWIHLAFTKNETALSIYINDKLDSSIQTTKIIDWSIEDYNMIGKDIRNNNDPFTGLIDEFRISNSSINFY